MKYTIVTAVLLLSACLVPAAFAQEGADLNQCQTAISKGSGKYLLGVVSTVGKCLHEISTQVVENGASVADAATSAAAACVTQFDKLRNDTQPSRQLSAKIGTKMARKCDPSTNRALLHDESATYEIGALTLSAARLQSYCASFGGDGTIDSFAEWRDCLLNSLDCQAHQAIATQWPRALEYFEALQPAIQSLPVNEETTDALAFLASLDAAVEGDVDDNLPELTCGPRPGCGFSGLNGTWDLTITGPLACNGETSIAVSGASIASTVHRCRLNPSLQGQVSETTGAFSMTETSSSTCGVPLVATGSFDSSCNTYTGTYTCGAFSGTISGMRQNARN